MKISQQSGELGAISCRTGPKPMKHQHYRIAAASGCAILDQPPTAGIDRRLDCDLRNLGQVLREKLGVE